LKKRNMDRLEAMSIVVLAIEKGSLTGAAKALHAPLPTISRKVSELEAYLGTKLFLRSTRKLTLTDAGQNYIEGAKRVIEQIEGIERAAAGEYTTPRGELVLTAPLLFGQSYLLPVVTDFLAAYPDINIQLQLSDRNLHLLEGQVDVAVRIGALPDSSIIATRIGSMDTLVCASPDLLAAHGKPKHPTDLQALPCVVFAGPSSAVWFFRDPATKRKFDINIAPRLSVSSAGAAVDAALRHTGFTRVYRYHCAAALRAGALVHVLKKFDVEELPVHLLHVERGLLPLKVRVFLDFAAQRLRSALAELAN
jgi:DNA-binding transcriptional LysR family regulator